MNDKISPFKSLYAAFDRFPLPKGASTHIRQMASTLFQYRQSGLLYVAGDHNVPSIEYDRIGGYNITLKRSCVDGTANILTKALAYADGLSALLKRHGNALDIAHFRDPWGGVPLVDFKNQHQPNLTLVYEVNALPSIELPIHLSLPPSTLHKIQQWETKCLDAADIIITPSKLTQQQLQQMTQSPVVYLPNGAQLATDDELQQTHKLANRLIYFGGAQRWQGLSTLLNAMVIVTRQIPAQLDLCLSLENRQAKQLKNQIDQLGLTKSVNLHFGLSQAELRPKIIQATASVAPLTACKRNMLQGCCPLKIIESMACGTPVITSNIPVVHELMQHNTHGLLTNPNRPSELARACIVLLSQPQLAQRMGADAYKHIQQHFQWQSINQQLLHIYQHLLEPSLTRTANEYAISDVV